MTDKLLKLLVCATISVISLNSCTIANSAGQISDFDNETIKSQIQAELAQVPSIDSIANTPVIVSPTIMVQDKNREIVKLCVILIPFVFTIAVIWIVLYYKRANLLDKYRIIDTALEKGITLPDSFYTDGRSTSKIKGKQLTNGMMWIAWGLGGMIFFFVVHAEEAATLCLFPILVGIVKVISSCLENKSSSKGNSIDADKI